VKQLNVAKRILKLCVGAGTSYIAGAEDHKHCVTILSAK